MTDAGWGQAVAASTTQRHRRDLAAWWGTEMGDRHCLDWRPKVEPHEEKPTLSRWTADRKSKLGGAEIRNRLYINRKSRNS